MSSIYEKTVKGICWTCGGHVPEDLIFHCSAACEGADPYLETTTEDPEEEILIEEIKTEIVQAASSHVCSHKYNCRAHREICVKIYNHNNL